VFTRGFPKGEASPFGREIFFGVAIDGACNSRAKAYDWVVWIVPKVEKFPKFSRFSIGQSLLASSLELLMNLVDATYEARNAGSLKAAVREVNRIRYLMRLAKDLRIVNIDSHEFAAKSLDEVGRMTGGWLKSSLVALLMRP